MSISEENTNGNIIKTDKLLSKQDLHEIVSKTIPEETFNIADVKIYPASEKKLGFICDHFKLAITTKVNGKTEEYNYFLKSLPIENAAKTNFIQEYNLFLKEEKMYQIMNNLSSYLGAVPWFPKLYFSNHKIIVLEDLNQKGYDSLSPRKTFTKEHFFLALSSLAKLQASSIIYEERRSRELGTKYRLEAEYKDDLDFTIFVMSGYYQITMMAMLAVVEQFSKYAGDEEKLQVIRSEWVNVWSENLKLAGVSDTFRNVISQRDLWSRNLMFRYEENTPSDCKIVDFQTIGCLPPAADIMSLLYLNLNRVQRQACEFEYTEYYYSEMRDHFSRNNFEIDQILPKKIFEESLQTYQLWGLMHSCLEYHMILLDSDRQEHLLTDSDFFDTVMNTLEGRKEFVYESLRDDQFYQNRLLESLEQLIDTYIFI